ncbi:MAG: A24 family peptidase [Mycobacteriaceae bacterium]|nr:A24 family peptidase [Mycobacteriaceae bacterium]
MGAAAVGVCVLTWFAGLSWFDIRERRLPNWLTMPGALAILMCAAATGHGASALTGAVTLFAIYLAMHLTAPAAMGAGDVKLAIGIGALTGAFGVDVWSLAAVTAPLLTAGMAVIVRIVCAERTVPHGPSMCAAAAAATALVLL